MRNGSFCLGKGKSGKIENTQGGFGIKKGLYSGISGITDLKDGYLYYVYTCVCMCVRVNASCLRVT